MNASSSSPVVGVTLDPELREELVSAKKKNLQNLKGKGREWGCKESYFYRKPKYDYSESPGGKVER